MAEAMNTWEAIRDGAGDVERLIGQKQYNLAMIKARQTLEIMVRALAKRSGIQAADMAEAIDELGRCGVISRTTAEHYHQIRLIGNKAAHEGDENPSGANTAYHLLSQELYTFAKDFSSGSSGRGISFSSRSADGSGSRSGRGTGSRSGYGSGSSAGSGGSADGRSGYGSGSSDSGRGREYGTGSSRSTGSQSASRTGSRRYSDGRGSSGSYSAGPSRISHRTSRKSTVTPELIFKIMIPVLAIVLILGIFKLVKKEDPEPVETEPELQIAVETTAPETEPVTLPPTEPETVMVYTVIPKVLNVRSEPNTSSSKLGQVHEGETLSFISNYDDEWVLINYNDQEGYVSRQYVDVRSMDLAEYEAAEQLSEAVGAEGAENAEAE